jgi:hypothetical protein
MSSITRRRSAWHWPANSGASVVISDAAGDSDPLPSDGKPVAIQKFIGRRPIAAFGNSDGDQQMLQWTAAGAGRRLAALVDHTDAEREFEYRVSPMGRLESALEEAQTQDWTIVSMRDDWQSVFRGG